MPDVAAQGSVARLRAAPLRLLGDERLAELAARGDRHAFAAIYERYHKPLYRYCVSLLGNAEDARDVLQTTLLAALRGLERRPLDGALRPWLYRIAHNASVSLMRARREQTELDERTAPAVDPPERAVAVRERLGVLFRDMRTLSTRQRSALLLRELSGLPYNEIAATFAITPAAARQTVFDARSALAELAAGHEEQCDTIRRTLSDGDRRVVRGRRIRGHLSGCPPCRAFDEHLRSRRRVLALVPAPPAAAAAAALQSLLGGGAASVAGGAAGGAATAGGLAAAPGVIKGVAVAASLVVAGVGAVGGADRLLPRDHHGAARHGVVRVAPRVTPPRAATSAVASRPVVFAAPRRAARHAAHAAPARQPRALGVARAQAVPGTAPTRHAPTGRWRPAKPTARATPPPPKPNPAAATQTTTTSTPTAPKPTNPVSATLSAARQAVSQAESAARTQLAAAQQQVSQALALARQQVQEATQGLSGLLGALGHRGGE